MENMLLEGFGLSNFKCFKDEIKIAQRPITINIGPNNSGKSSLLKAINLFHHSLIRNNFIYRNDNRYILPEIDSFHIQNFGEPENFLNNPSKELMFRIPISMEENVEWYNKKTIEISFHYSFENQYQYDFDKANLLRGGKREIAPPGLGELNKYIIYLDNHPFIEISRNLQPENIKDGTDFGNFGEIKVNTTNIHDSKTIEYLIIPLEIDSNKFHNIKKLLEIINKTLQKNKIKNVDKLTHLFSSGFESICMFQEYISKIKFIDLNRREYGRHFELNKSILFRDFFDFYFSRQNQNIAPVKNFLRKILPLFNIPAEIEIQRIGNIGFSLFIIDKNGKHRNIVDYGSAINQLIPLLLLYSTQINSVHEYDKINNNFKPRYLNSLIIVEEPECNFHPNFQSKLADLFLHLYQETNLNFIIETHSEYLVRKFQFLAATKRLNNEDIIINYFWKKNDNHKCKQIEFDQNGGLSNSFENGFYDESYQLKYELLKTKNLN